MVCFFITTFSGAPDVSLRVLSVVRRALYLSDISLEKAGLWMGQDRSNLHRQLNGEGHLSVARLALLPVGFWMWFGLLLIEEYGLPKEAQHAARIALALVGRRRMARIAAHQPQRRSA